MTLEQKFFNKEKPKNGQVIIIRERGAYYPSIGKYKVLQNGKEEIDLLYHDFNLKLNEIESWWIGFSDEFLKKYKDANY